MWYQIKKYLFSGLLIILPIFFTLIIVLKIFSYLIFFISYYLPFNKIIEYLIDSNITNPLLLNFSRPISYSFSLCITFLLIVLIGFITFNFINNERLKWFERIFLKIPFSRTIYSTVKQISQIFLSDNLNAFRQVVILEYPKSGMYSLGFLTNPRITIKEKEDKNCVAVFIPTAPNPTTGMFVFLKKEEVIILDMKVEEALKLIISGGAITPEIIS